MTETGIRDKNGKMICAGDHVIIPGSPWAHGTVVFRKIWVVDVGDGYAPLDVSPRPMIWQISAQQPAQPDASSPAVGAGQNSNQTEQGAG